MVKMFISSHGHFASGIKSSLDILIGNTDNITVFDAYVDEFSVQSQLDNFFNTVKKDEQVILLSDLYGGSVNSTMLLYAQRPNTILITGINLSLVLEIAVRDSIDKDELKEIVENSRNMMLIVDSVDLPTEDEDFF